MITAFAKLKLLGSEQTYARSLVGLQAQIEALVMTNNLAKFGMLQTRNRRIIFILLRSSSIISLACYGYLTIRP